MKELKSLFYNICVSGVEEFYFFFFALKFTFFSK
jgi:hypothetical protein